MRLLLSSVRDLKERVQFHRYKQLRLLKSAGKSASGYVRVKYCVFSIQDITATVVVAYGYTNPDENALQIYSANYLNKITNRDILRNAYNNTRVLLINVDDKSRFHSTDTRLLHVHVTSTIRVRIYKR